MTPAKPMSDEELEREARQLAQLFGIDGTENGHAYGVMDLARRYAEAQKGWSPINKDKLIKILNEARCLSKRTVGNAELADRILSAQLAHTPTDADEGV